MVDWNDLPAFPAGIPTSAPGHLITPSSEECNADVEAPAVQALDLRIDSPAPVDKASSPHSLVHEEVITPAKDKVFVENVDHMTLPTVVEDSEPQSTSQTFIVDPSFSCTLSNEVVNNTQIIDEGIMVEEAGQGRKVDVEIISEDVIQLVGEDSANESAPTKKSSEDTVDDQIGSEGAETLQETMIHMGESFSLRILFHAVANTLPVSPQVEVANTEDDIPPSIEAIDQQMDNQTQPSAASTSSVQIPLPVYQPHHTFSYGQLPTPPPEQSSIAQSPSVATDGPSYISTSLSKGHSVEMEEVQDEDDVRPQPFLGDSVDLWIDNESIVEPRYTVIEPEPHFDYEVVNAEVDFDVEVVSARSASPMWDDQSNFGEMYLPMHYIVEEPLTDGRLTEVGFIF